MSPVPTRRRGLAALVAAALAVAGAALLVTPTAAYADASDHSHDPFGHVATVRMSDGGVRMVGWAADPDSIKSSLNYVTLADGRVVTDGPVTGYPYVSAQREHNLGPNPGFRIITHVPAGTHSFCLAARNTGAGIDTILKCVALPLGRTMSESEKDKHSPVGRFVHAWARNGRMYVQGWSDDPDFISRQAVVVLYVDGQSVATRNTYEYHGGRYAGSGYRSRIGISVPVSSGTHVGCLWAVNVSIGHNKFLGCRTRDTRGPAGTGAVSTPRLNQQVVNEAITHRGQSYVWGAAGPRSFDCSGLVLYSYQKFGYTTPRVSAAQRVAARLIPASRAVPGDLVFYHDQTGDVYHVGIYVSPGKTVAAIDTQEGVDWQRIWDPSTATYGSFTHS